MGRSVVLPAFGRCGLATVDHRDALVRAGNLQVAALAVDDTHVYWLAGVKAGEPVLFSVPKSGGPPAALATLVSATGTGRALAVDDTYVYWAPSGRIERLPKSGGPATTLADLGPSSPYQLMVVNDTAVYAATWGQSGDIVMIAK
jgi:hypothetical protein